MNAARSEMVQALRDAGHRLTQPRLAVIRVLQENEEGLEPAEVHRQGRAYCQSLGLVTVYRTLDLLTDLGLVRRVHSEQQCHTYASAADGRHYLICQRCHRVTEFPCEGLAELIEGVRRRLGYTVTEHLLELSGVCPDCQALEAGDGADADAGRR